MPENTPSNQAPPCPPPPPPSLVNDVGWLALLTILILLGLSFYAASWFFSAPKNTAEPPPQDFVTTPQPAEPPAAPPAPVAPAAPLD